MNTAPSLDAVPLPIPAETSGETRAARAVVRWFRFARVAVPILLVILGALVGSLTWGIGLASKPEIPAAVGVHNADPNAHDLGRKIDEVRAAQKRSDAIAAERNQWTRESIGRVLDRLDIPRPPDPPQPAISLPPSHSDERNPNHTR